MEEAPAITLIPMPMTRKRPAFSLVELLTVIAVIAVLAGILVPIVSTIRARADVLECSSNLRQLG
ncbi:MAG: type II secretion system protein, partial [Puniceicoccales bacterium]